MASVDGITVAKAQEIEDALVVSGSIVNGELILTTNDGTIINAGSISDYADSVLSDHEADLTTHGATGAVMGTTNVQTASNKTLLLPIISDFTNAQHDHGDADDGGPLAIGRADSPAPVLTLNSVNMGDADPPKTIASIICPPGRWLILATVEGVTLAVGGTLTRFSFNLNASSPTFNGKPIASSSDTAFMNGGRSLWGWLENAANSTITFTITKNGSGALITTSTQGSLIAIRMG